MNGINGGNFRQVRARQSHRPWFTSTSAHLHEPRPEAVDPPRGERAMSLLRVEAPYLPDLKQPPGREPS